jgi:hypothetical protein
MCSGALYFFVLDDSDDTSHAIEHTHGFIQTNGGPLYVSNGPPFVIQAFCLVFCCGAARGRTG